MSLPPNPHPVEVFRGAHHLVGTLNSRPLFTTHDHFHPSIRDDFHHYFKAHLMLEPRLSFKLIPYRTRFYVDMSTLSVIG